MDATTRMGGSDVMEEPTPTSDAAERTRVGGRRPPFGVSRMTIRQKAFVLVLLPFLLLFLVLNALTQRRLLESFTALESQSALRSAGELARSLNFMAGALRTQTRDWALWDDMYRFVQDRNREFLRANFAMVDSEAAGEWTVDAGFALIVDRAGEVVLSRDMSAGHPMGGPAPSEVATLAMPGGRLHQSGPGEGVTGYMVLGGRPAMVSAFPILDSLQREPVRGTLVFGRFLEDRLDRLEAELGLRLAFVPFQAFMEGEDGREMPPRFGALLDPVVLAGPHGRIHIYLPVRDVFDQPSFVARADMERAVYSQAQRALRALSTVILMFLALAGLVILLLIENSLVGPLMAVSGQVAAMSSRLGGGEGEVPGRAGDELGTLSSRFQGLMGAFQRSEAALKENQDRLRSLANRLVLAEERERRRIADLIHGNVVQKTAVAKITLEKHFSRLGPEADLAVKDRIVAHLDQAIAAARASIFELSPPVLDVLGFGEAVAWLAEEFQDASGTPCSVDVTGDVEGLPQDTRTLIFHSVRELLNNAAKYSRASRARVSMVRTTTNVVVGVHDDGVGFDPSRIGVRTETKSGLGLYSIRERLSYVGGDLFVESAEGQGATVYLIVPLQQKE